MIDSIDRKKYIKKYKTLAEDVIYKEQLPFASDILNFAIEDKVSPRLQHLFDFFDNREELSKLVRRESLNFSEEEGTEFINTVISANVSDIRTAGSLYKQLQATGDDLRIRGEIGKSSEDCGSKGRKIELPIEEDEFLYSIRNSWVRFNEDEDLQVFYNYNDFMKAAKGHDSVFVKTPMTCKHAKKRGVCPTCAGQIPPNTQNIGAFSTLMVTEFATQSALSSMNKGSKDNVNTLLIKSARDINTWEEFFEWSEDILQSLKGKDVERRFYEIVLLGRARADTSSKEKNRVNVSPLSAPKTDNYFGKFIYRPRETTFRELVSQEEPFEDTSLKLQIGLNDFRKGLY